MAMQKQQALRLFGNKAALLQAMSITRQAYEQWPDLLSREKSDQIIGCALRLGVKLSRRIMEEHKRGVA
jgi:hypothetical protein